MAEKAPGIDISHWQNDITVPGEFDFAKARAQGITFAGIKISQANYADRDYALNWANAKRHVYRMPFHFITWTTDPKRQAEVFWSLLEADTDALLPLMADFEWWGDNPTPPNAMDVLYNFMERLKALSAPLPLGIYTAKSFWVPSGSTSIYWAQYHLWLCDIAGEVEIPAPWKAWSFWQYTFKLPGLQYGSESRDLDGDYYNGCVEDMRLAFNLPDIGIEAPAPVPQPLPTEAIRYRVLKTMNIRSGPGTGYTDVGDLTAGDIVTVEDIGGGNVWIKIGSGKWAAVQYNGIRYMERV